MNAALVPVRSISGSKNRLSSCLSLAQREQLALAMLGDMISALQRSASIDRVFVLSADPDLLDHARTLGAEVIHEGRPRGLNPAVSMAAAFLADRGVARLLIIPGDVPLLDPDEIDQLFAVDAEHYPVVLAPSAAGSGTNGLLCSPPCVIEFRFEGASRKAHRQACEKAGVKIKELDLPGFAVDIDTPEELEALEGSSGESGRLFAEWNANPGSDLFPSDQSTDFI